MIVGVKAPVYRFYSTTEDPAFDRYVDSIIGIMSARVAWLESPRARMAFRLEYGVAMTRQFTVKEQSYRDTMINWGFFFIGVSIALSGFLYDKPAETVAAARFGQVLAIVLAAFFGISSNATVLLDMPAPEVEADRLYSRLLVVQAQKDDGEIDPSIFSV
jgi:uncharacterized membrane protein